MVRLQFLSFAILLVWISIDSHTVIAQGLTKQNSIYKPLIKYLKDGYDPLAMPVCGKKAPIDVSVDMWLYQLFDLDEPTQQLTIDVWVDMVWRDCGLVWDPKAYNGIDQIALPASEIWRPDIIYYESLHGNFEEGMFVFKESVARIRNDGMVQLGCQVLLKSFCRVKIADYPFDSHKCNLTFASWNKDSTVFNLTKRDKNEYRGHAFKQSSNGEWDVNDFPAFDSIGTFALGFNENETQNYTQVTFQLHLTRKPLFVKVYLIAPCILMIWVTVLVFILPVESGEKISLSVTILLSLIVFLLLVADNIPRSSDGVPVLGVFFSMAIGLVCLSTLFTTIVVNVGNKTKDICMPATLRKLLLSPLSRLFCFRYREDGPHKWMVMRARKRSPTNRNNDGGDEGGEGGNMVSDGDKPCHNDLSERNEWRFLAMLLDRVFLIIYLILTIILTVYIACR